MFVINWMIDANNLFFEVHAKNINNLLWTDHQEMPTFLTTELFLGGA